MTKLETLIRRSDMKYRLEINIIKCDDEDFGDIVDTETLEGEYATLDEAKRALGHLYDREPIPPVAGKRAIIVVEFPLMVDIPANACPIDAVNEYFENIDPVVFKDMHRDGVSEFRVVDVQETPEEL